MARKKKEKWQQPESPPPPLFTNQKEKDLVKQINDELIERVIGQQIVYYPISLEHTDFHPLYGEALTKTFLPPVHVYALVEPKRLFGDSNNKMEIAAKCIKAREGTFDAK